MHFYIIIIPKLFLNLDTWKKRKKKWKKKTRQKKKEFIVHDKSYDLFRFFSNNEKKKKYKKTKNDLKTKILWRDALLFLESTQLNLKIWVYFLLV